MGKNIFELFDPKDFIKLKKYKEYITVDDNIKILFAQKEEKYHFKIDKNFFIHPDIKNEIKEYIEEQFTETYITQPVYMLELKNAFIYKRTTLTSRHFLLTVGNKYISSLLSTQSLNYYEEHTLLERLENNKIKILNPVKPDISINKNCLFLYSFSNLYHILMEVIPNLIFIKKVDINDMVFLLYGQEKNMLENILRMLGFKNIFIKLDNLNIHVKNLFLPSYQTFGHISEPRKDSLFFPRKLALNTKYQKEYEYIYISRNDASQRITINEDEVKNLLKKYNFKIIQPGNFSIQEQIEIFSNAKYIVAPHGMGITNILFCKKQFTLVEIFVDGWTRNFYYRIVQLLGGSYRGVFLPSLNKNNDLNIDLAILERILEEDLKV